MKTYLKILVLLCTLILVAVSAFSQDTTQTKTTLVSNPEAVVTQPNSVEMHNDIQHLKDALTSLRNQVESQNKVVYYIVGLFTLFSFFGAGFTILSYRSNERKAESAEARAAEIHTLTLGNDKSSQERANIIFEESQRTLALVNDILELAEKTSRRASKSLETRLQKSMEIYDGESMEIIEKSQAYDDDKNLTTDKDICSEIHRVGRKIEGLENNLIMLEGSEIILEPYCCLVRGADSYLSELFNQALEYWKKVVKSKNADKRLQSLAYFWIGYVNNNLGEQHFSTAIQNFKKAQVLATDSRKYELMRIKLETRFFNNEAIEPIIDEFDELIKLIDNHDKSEESASTFDMRKKKILTTLGNIYYQLAIQTKSDELKKKYLLDSKKTFADLLNLNEKEDIFDQLNRLDNNQKDKEKWIIFGYTESLYQLNEKRDVSEKIFNEIIYHLAENEFLNREEKRTKVLAKTTQLICAIRTGKSRSDISNIKTQVDSALGGVDKRLTIYSQLQRRNVKRESFREDLNKLLN